MAIHDRRHTAASPAVFSGANVKPVRKLLGHASAATTVDVDADLFEDDLDAVAERFDQAAAVSSVTEMWLDDDRPGADEAPSRSKIPEDRASSGGGT